MHKTIYRYIFLLLLAMCAAVAGEARSVKLTPSEQAWIKAHPQIVIGVERSWSPMVVENEDGSLSGIDHDTVAYLNEVLGTHIILRTGKWSGLIDALKNREIDGLSSAAIVPDHLEYAVFTDAYNSIVKSIYVKKGNPQHIRTLEDLGGKRVAVMKGNAFDNALVAGYDNVTIIHAADYKKTVDLVLSGEADAFIGSDLIHYNLIDMSITSVEPVFTIGEPIEMVFAIRKDWPELVRILNKGILTLSQKQKREIKERYVSRNTEPDYELVFETAGGLLMVLLASFYWVRRLKGEVARRQVAEAELTIANRELEKNIGALNAAQKLAHMGSWELEIATGKLTWSDETYNIFGIDHQSVVMDFDRFNAYIHPDDVEMLQEVYSSSLKAHTDYYVEHRIVRADGEVRYVVEQGHHIYDDRGEPLSSMGTVHDVTDHMIKERELKDKLQKFIDAQESIVLLTDGKTVKFANRKFLDFFNCETIEAFVAAYVCICNRFIEKEGFFHLGKVAQERQNWIEAMLSLSGRARIVSMDDAEGTPHAFTVSISSYDAQRYVLTFTDISDSMLEKLQLEHEATIDQLTGAFNRVYFNKYIEKIMQQHEKQRLKTGIIFFDIDRFKQINDTYGHDIGDSVLKQLVALVRKYTRNDDRLVRWGGEEFILFIQAKTVEDVIKNAEHIRSTIEKNVFDSVAHLTCSFGCALHGTGDVMTTISHADEALYEAKNSGRNRVCSYADSLPSI